MDTTTSPEIYLYRAASGTCHIVPSYSASVTRCGRTVDSSEVPQSAPQGAMCPECEARVPDFLDADERLREAITADAELVRDGFHPERDA